MILGNVINKLSESAKLRYFLTLYLVILNYDTAQLTSDIFHYRAHIPYRDSKLTRILQPALGGNAKTCIISTIAPEEHHIEESKGTLQFASRAKCITNCAQVNEGSHAEVLEQEILKLSNQMLKYELECERLKTQLEEERREQKEQEQCIKDQQLKIENLNILVTQTSRRTSQRYEFINWLSLGDVLLFLDDFISLRKTPDVLCNVIDSSDFPGSPCFKSTEPSFVVARSSYLGLSDFSPMVHSFGDMADKDTWTKLNKGFVADLDKIQFTPAVRSQPTPLTTPTMNELLTKEKDSLQVSLYWLFE
ncbi:hypothetical protein YC2023_011188 [Brassica napus]